MTARHFIGSRRAVAVVWALALGLVAAAGPGAAQQRTQRSAEMVTVEPKVTDELLANPHMGWQTFHHTRDKDKSLPAWIPSTVHYARWGWKVLEPKPGEFDYAFLDKVLKETRQAGQQLAFRVMCASTTPGRPYQPDWLKEVGGKELKVSHGQARGLVIPDLDDPEVLERHVALIRALGSRYDGHPDLDHVDLGSVGWWGEWHMSQCPEAKMPKPATLRRIVDAYLESFRKTPLVMLIGGGEWLTYAAERGTGWRADCLGDMGGFSKTWCHMRMAYPKMSQQKGVADAWKTAPVAWESCWDMRKWVEEGWPVRYIFDYALALHGSYLNNKSAPLPEGENIRPEIERFLRRLGYRLVLRQLTHPRGVRAGQPLALKMKWQNVGSAPCYRPYRLAWRLSKAGAAEKVLVGKVTVNRWMPGTVELFTKDFFAGKFELPDGPVVDAADTVALPQDLAPGVWQLSLAVVGEETDKPVVRLGIVGRGEDGWYRLSEVSVGK